jgi:hypothetical protein
VNGVGKPVANPADPLQKVRVGTREANEHKGILHERLLNRIYEWGVLGRICTVILFGNDIWSPIRHTTVKLEDAWLSANWKIIDRYNDLIATLQHIRKRALKERIIIGREHVRPRQLQEQPVKSTRLIMCIRDRTMDRVIKRRRSECSFEFKSQATTVPFV